MGRFTKIILVSALMSVFAVLCASAEDVVYLKNGNIIKGKVIEQVEGGDLKIEMAGGSIVKFAMSDVDRVGKQREVFYDTKIKKGYRGFVDLGFTYVFSHDGQMAKDSHNDGKSRLELMTSHGYQFNEYLFVGAGLGYIRSTSNYGHGYPIFVHVRGDLMKKSITPFVDLKTGYSIDGFDGLFLSASVGCRFVISGDIGLNVSLGYSLQNDSYKKLVIDYYANKTYVDKAYHLDGICVRLGVDF